MLMWVCNLLVSALALVSVWRFLACKISHELVGELEPNYMDITLGHDEDLIRFW